MRAKGDSKRTRALFLSSLVAVCTVVLPMTVVTDESQAMVKQFKGNMGVGILLEQGDDFGAVVASYPFENQLFYIKSGKYRGQKIIPSANGQKFVGLTTDRDGRTIPKPVLNGSVVLKGWKPLWHTQDGCRIWHVRHEDPPPWYRNGSCANPYDPNGGGFSVPESMGGNLPCTFPQVLFITNPGYPSPTVCWRWRTLEELFSGEVPSGSWYYDSDTDGVYVKVKAGLDMNAAGRKVEISKTRFAFGYDETIIHDPIKRSGIVIKNLVIEKYANPAQTGAVGYYRPGGGWIVENCEVRYNHGVGVKFTGPAVIRNNYLHHNGQFGVACGDGDPLNSETSPSELSELMPSDHENRGWADGYAGSGAKVLDNVISKNQLKQVGFNTGWGAGGSKFSQVSNLLIRDNKVLNNHGPGIWFDFAEDNNVIDWNRVEGNEGVGIFVEISGSVRNNRSTLLPERIPPAEVKSTLVRNNFCASNGEAGIVLSSSNKTNVKNNIVISDGRNSEGHGILMLQVQDYDDNQMKPCYINRHVEYINVYSTSNCININDIVYTTENGASGAKGYYYTYLSKDYKVYKIIAKYGYPWIEQPPYQVNFKLLDRWDFFGTQNKLNAGKPFQNNRYHLKSDNELHWWWYKGPGDDWAFWNHPLTLNEFKALQLDVDATTDSNIDYGYWLNIWKAKKASRRQLWHGAMGDDL